MHAPGAQALVAWSLRQHLSSGRLSMVAEEDADDLRCGWSPWAGLWCLLVRLPCQSRNQTCMCAQDLKKSCLAVCRQKGGNAMAQTITSLVNETLQGSASLSQDEVLDLIDLGNSKGGSEVRQPVCCLMPLSLILTGLAALRLCKLQGQHWVLDPIDGTRGFVGLRQYAVCLGLLDEGQVLQSFATALLILTRPGTAAPMLHAWFCT